MNDEQCEELCARIRDGVSVMPREVQTEAIRFLDMFVKFGPRDILIALDKIMPAERGGFPAVADAYQLLLIAGFKNAHMLMDKDSYGSYERVVKARHRMGIPYATGMESPAILVFTALNAKDRARVESLLMERPIVSKQEALDILSSASSVPSAMSSGVL